MPIFPASETAFRIKKLQEILQKKGTAIAVFNQGIDLFYFTGSFQPLYLIIPAVGKPVLLVRKALERAIEESSGMPVETFVQTGDRTVMSYLAKPLYDQITRAFREK